MSVRFERAFCFGFSCTGFKLEYVSLAINNNNKPLFAWLFDPKRPCGHNSKSKTKIFFEFFSPFFSCSPKQSTHTCCFTVFIFHSDQSALWSLKLFLRILGRFLADGQLYENMHQKYVLLVLCYMCPVTVHRCLMFYEKFLSGNGDFVSMHLMD